MKLTERHRVLLERLVTLGEWATAGELPFDVVEIRGFGSFFRGKTDPNDVDLIVRCHRYPPRADFERFLQLLERIRYDAEYERKFETPKEALLEANQCVDAGAAPHADRAEVETRRFVEWLEGFSWNMLHPQTIAADAALECADTYAERMVKRHLPKLSITKILNADQSEPEPVGLRCGFTVSIWSRDNPDVRSNVLRLLVPEQVRQHSLRDLASLEVQIEAKQAEIALLRLTIDSLLKTRRRTTAANSSYEWLIEWTQNEQELQPVKQRLKLARGAADQFDDEKRAGAELPECYRDLPQSQASQSAAERRCTLKLLHNEAALLKAVKLNLAHFKSGVARTILSAKQYVASEVLLEGGKRGRESRREFLEQIGFLP